MMSYRAVVKVYKLIKAFNGILALLRSRLKRLSKREFDPATTQEKFQKAGKASLLKFFLLAFAMLILATDNPITNCKG